jgi:ubiquinone/menaquinone biosynthesis C-methylase UbiE/uncharacterized protein YbaR (Trm112 family)
MIKQNELLKLMICPRCHTPLQSLSLCSKCGLEFAANDGTPIIIRKTTTQTVEIKYSSNPSAKDSEFRRCFQYPPQRGVCAANKPYHLDLAHLNIIENLNNSSTILEIGCGGGQMRNYIESKGHQYIGTDISKTRVHDWLQEYGGPDILCDVHVLPFQDQTFDVVYSAAVTEHLTCPYLVVQEVARVLKPGGFYLGNVSFLEPWHDDSLFHMSPLGAFELLKQADFEILYIWPGQNYSGFHAMMNMSNKVLKSLQFIGHGTYLLYKAGNQVRDLIKKSQSETSNTIMDNGKIAGAVDWIAKRPLE